MKRAMLAMVLGLGGVMCASAENATQQNAVVALCVDCTKSSQFDAAGKLAARAGTAGKYTVLVVNPDTGMSEKVTVEGAGQRDAPPRAEAGSAAQMDDVVRFGDGSRASIFIAKGDGAIAMTPAQLKARQNSRGSGGAGPAAPASGQSSGGAVSYEPTAAGLAVTRVSPSSGSNATAMSAKPIERGALVKLDERKYVIELPARKAFSSYSGADPAVVARAIFSAMLEKATARRNVELLGPPGPGLVKMLRGHFDRSTRVCTLFNNGDSACYRPLAEVDDAPNLVPGSARDVNGKHLPDDVAGGGGTDR